MMKIKFKDFMYKKTILFATLLVAFFATTTVFAQNSIFEVMSHKEVLSVTLKADFAAIDSSRRSDDKYKAELTFKDETGAVQTWNVNLKIRGKFRRLKCEMAPLKINFKKKELKAAGLAKFDDMKLVTHCVSSKSAAKALLQKEYLAYKLYNELTEFSYRVQLLKINYVDVHTGKKTKHWAFLIEDTAEFRHRIDATASVENYFNLSRDTFHDGLLKIAAVYQYMIGNSDWDIESGRNVKYIIKNGKVLPIPYDFDFSGLVDAPYAIPNPNFGITSVQNRIFLGFKNDVEKLKGTFAYFKTKRMDLINLVNQFYLLDEMNREKMIYYLDSFYTTLDEFRVGEKIDLSTKAETNPVGTK